MRLSARPARWIIPLVSVLVQACTSEGPTSPDRLVVEILKAERRWQRTKTVNYSFNSVVSCFCLDNYTANLAVVVRNGAITSVTDVPTGAVRPLNYREPFDRAFSTLLREAASDPANLEATYDATYGFPVRYAFGSRKFDGFTTVTITDFRPLP